MDEARLLKYCPERLVGVQRAYHVICSIACCEGLGTTEEYQSHLQNTHADFML